MIERKVLLLLPRGFEDLEAAAVVAVCGWTEYREHLPTVRVTTTGLHEEVGGRFGTRIRPDSRVGEVVPDDYVALAPGYDTGWVGRANSAGIPAALTCLSMGFPLKGWSGVRGLNRGG